MLDVEPNGDPPVNEGTELQPLIVAATPIATASGRSLFLGSASRVIISPSGAF
jgi:hypothetical protein